MVSYTVRCSRVARLLKLRQDIASALSAAHSLQQSRDKVVTSTLLFDVVSAPDQQQPL